MATLEDVLNGVLIGFVVFISTAIGSTVEVSNLRKHFRKPKGLAIGWVSQFGILPLLAFALTKVFDMNEAFSVGVLLVGCSPGGVTSQYFTYLARGDVELSISMTVMSTLLSFGMLPALLAIYLSSQTTTIPFLRMMTVLLLVVIPACLGIFIRYKKPRAARTVEKIGSIAGSAFIVVAVVMAFVVYDETKNAPAYIWGGSFILSVTGTIFGYGAAWLAKLPRKQCLAVCLETGVQNTTLPLAMVVLSFEGKFRDQAAAFPIIYSIFVVGMSVIYAGLFRWIEKKYPDDNDMEIASRNADDLKPTSGAGEKQDISLDADKIVADQNSNSAAV